MLERVELRERKVPQVGKGVGSEVQGMEQGCLNGTLQSKKT